MSETPRVLYVEAGSGDRAAAFERRSVDVVRATDGLDGLVRLEETPVDGVVVVGPLPDLAVDRFVRDAKRTAPALPVIVVGELDALGSLGKCFEAGATTFVETADTPETVVDRFEDAVREARIEQRLARTRRLRGLIAEFATGTAGAQTTDDIEGLLFELLTESDLYRFSWLGSYDLDSDTFRLRWPQSGEFSEASVAGLLGVEDERFIHRAVEDGTVEIARGRIDTRSTASEAQAGGSTSPGGYPNRTDLSALAVPFVHGSSVNGVALLAANRGDAFTDAEVESLGDLGELVGDALHRREVGTDPATGQSDRAKRVAELFAHQLRNPLSIASMYLEIAREEDEPEAFDRAAAALERLDDILDGILSIARADGLETATTRDIGADAEEAWALVDAPEATLEVTDSRPIEADHGLVVQLLTNLFENAVSYAGDNVAVRVGTFDDGFFVEDDGPGIPPDRRDRVTEWGYSTTEDGTGFGLAVVEEIAAAHGWSVAITDGTIGGARIEISGVDGGPSAARGATDE